jgi:predicted nucleic acid-binding protein
LRSKVIAKTYLAARISADHVEVVPEISEPFPAAGRDRKDDYLFAHALIDRADYLVSGDEDLLSVGQIDGVKLVSPARFLVVLHEAGRLERSRGAQAPAVASSSQPPPLAKEHGL